MSLAAMEETPVVVVGAGLTGLAVGRGLVRRGVESLTLEAAPRPGGVVRSPRVEGRVLDAGPQRVRLVSGVGRLIRDLDLENRLIRTPPGLPMFVYWEGRLRRVPTGVRELLGTDLLSARGKLRLLVEPFSGAVREGESVEAYAVRALGREAAERIVAPLYAGIYGSDPHAMPADRTLERTLERMGASGSLVVAALRWMRSGGAAPPAVSLRGGMQELTDALYDEARERIRLGTPVRRVRPIDPDRTAEAPGPGRAGSGDGDDRPRWVVETERAAVTARHVVLTCPADEAARVLAEAAPGAARRLGSLRYNPLAVVHLESDFEGEGYGYQVAGRGTMGTLGVTWNDSLFGHEEAGRAGVYTAFLGGAGRRDLVEKPNAEVGERARAEFERVTGAPARVLRVGRTRMPAWDRSWEALEGLTLPAGLHVAGNWVSRPGIPGRLEEAAAVAEAAAG